MRTQALTTVAAMVASVPAAASELRGPGRFCGYAPIVDLVAGEHITTLEGGVHGGRFRWEGAWGVMTVDGVGWASRPVGRAMPARTVGGAIRFAGRRDGSGHVVAIWNGRQGAAYFRSDTRFTPDQMAAIDRVRLYQEGEEPSGCDLRTAFSWGDGQ